MWMLAHRHPHFQEMGATGLVELGAPAVEPLLRALSGGDADLRARSAGVLGALRDLRALPFLRRALADRDLEVRQAATQALAQIGAPAVEYLIPVLLDEGWDAASRAAQALGEIEDARATAPLAQVLRRGHPIVRIRAATALGKIGDVEALEPLCAALDDGEGAVRQQAAEALGKLGDGRAAPALVARLVDPERRVRRASALALASLGWTPGGAAHRARWAVAAEDWEGAVAEGPAAVTMLCGLLQDTDGELHLPAARALERIAARTPTPALRAALPCLRRLIRWNPVDAAAASYAHVILQIERATTALKDLPLPAAASSLLAEELPLPAAPASPVAEALPIPAGGGPGERARAESGTAGPKRAGGWRRWLAWSERRAPRRFRGGE